MASTYLDRLEGIETSVAVKAPVRVATTANITLSGEQTVDGVALVGGDRVLVKDQASAIDNGIWNVSTGAWSRAEDFNGVRDAVQGTRVYVVSGAVNGNTEWSVTTDDPQIGASGVAFTQLASLGGLHFGSVADLLASTSLTVATGEVIYAGGMLYEVAATGASDHHVTTAGGVKLYVLPVGAVYNVEAWGPVTAASFNTAARQVADIASAQADFLPRYVFRCASEIATDIQLRIERTGGLRVTGMNIDLALCQITAQPGGSLTPATPVLYIRSRNSETRLGFIDCNRVSSGVNLKDCMGSTLYLGQVRRFPTPGATVYGVKIDGQTDNIRVMTGVSVQWALEDAEFATLANFTGRAFWLDGIDFNVSNIYGGWCGTPIYLDVNCSLVWLIDVHPYNGHPSVTRTDPPLIESRAGGVCYLHDSYLDNGIVHDYSANLQIFNCHHLELLPHAIINDAEVRVYCSAARDGLSPSFSRFTGNTGLSITFRDDETGTYSWAGSDLAIANIHAAVNQQGVNAAVSQRDIRIFYRADTLPYEQIVRMGGFFQRSFHTVTGGGAVVTLTETVDPEMSRWSTNAARLRVNGWEAIGAGAPLVIAAGSVTATSRFHTIDTEGAAPADDLDTITTAGVPDGAMLTLCAQDSARDVTVKNGAGNIFCGSDRVLSLANKTITLMKFGGGWRMVSFADNT